ncbi:tetratricopeptide repeat protein 22-like [Amphiura filiformis]|uniref:tetratricopeptide repeat protein 22-like n=1 Tax=Amphiura filiformis TaxID=82378 RepID=UPI003B2259A8
MDGIFNDQPGFSQLPLEVNAETFDYDDIASFKFKRWVRQLDEEKQYRPEGNVIRNFLGYVAACIEWYWEAERFFKQVLDEDPDNLNALTNLKRVYQTLDAKDKTYEIARKLKELETVLNRNDERSKRLKARCLVEKGYAICQGASEEHEESFLAASAMYEKALEMAGDLVTVEEKTDWYLGKVRVKQVLFNKRGHWRMPQPDVELERNFFNDVQMVLTYGDDFMKAESWVKIGSVFRQLHRMYYGAEPPICVREKPQILKCYRSSRPLLACYNMALKYKPNHPPILAKKAGLLKSNRYQTPQEQDFQLALHLLDESIRADSSIFNRCSFSMKAEALMDFYRALKRNRQWQANHYKLLIEAKNTFETSLSMHTEPADCRQLGEIWLYLSDDYSDEKLLQIVGKTKAECMEKALEFYTIATEIVPSGSGNPHAHWKRGECLFKMNDLEGAAESYKRGIDCYNFPCRDMLQNHGKLFYTQLQMLDLDGGNHHANTIIAEDVAHCLERAIDQFGKPGVVEKCIRYFCNGHEEFAERCLCFISICEDIGKTDLAVFLQKHVPSYW